MLDKNLKYLLETFWIHDSGADLFSTHLSTDPDQRFPFLLQVQDGLQGGRPQTVPQYQEKVRVHLYNIQKETSVTSQRLNSH